MLRTKEGFSRVNSERKASSKISAWTRSMLSAAAMRKRTTKSTGREGCLELCVLLRFRFTLAGQVLRTRALVSELVLQLELIERFCDTAHGM